MSKFSIMEHLGENFKAKMKRRNFSSIRENQCDVKYGIVLGCCIKGQSQRVHVKAIEDSQKHMAVCGLSLLSLHV